MRRICNDYATAAVAIPRRFEKSAAFDRLEWIEKASPKAFKHARDFARAPKTTMPPYFVGPSGGGKTTLMWAMVAELVKQHNQALASRAEALCDKIDVEADSPELSDEKIKDGLYRVAVEVSSGADIAHALRSSVHRDSVDLVVDGYRQASANPHAPVPDVRILCIDDVEVFKASEWIGEELYRIIDYRYANERPTVVASNLSPDELAKHLGDRIVRRLVDITAPCQVG